MNNEECLFLNSAADCHVPSEFTETHHVHILMRRGAMVFSDGKSSFRATKDDLVIWQMANSIQQVKYSADFEADFLIVGPQFLSHFNPEMVWATRGYIFIRRNPVFHLDADALQLIEGDFALFRQRQGQTDNPFRREVLGRVMQMFLYDLWLVYRNGLTQMETTDTASQLFFRFLGLAEGNVLAERGVAFYADRLCVTTKYLSQVCRSVSGLSAMQWITYYASFEIVRRLDNPALTLTDIADELGFSSLQFFSRYVSRCLGLSPSDYRKSKGL